EVAGLGSVAEDRDRPAFQKAPEEDGNGGGVRRVRILLRAVDVEEAQADGLERPAGGPVLGIEFADQLRQGIGGPGSAFLVFPSGQPGSVAVDGGWTGEHPAPA